MNRETDSQGDMLEHQLDHDRKMRAIDRLNDLITQGAKGLATLNGGGVVAMLAFIQALVEKPVYRAFKPYALGTLACFILGAFLSVIVFFFRHTSQNSSPQKMLGRDVLWILITSAFCALIGGSLVTLGIYIAV